MLNMHPADILPFLLGLLVMYIISLVLIELGFYDIPEWDDEDDDYKYDDDDWP